jgi:hypothetical protein
MNVRQQIKRNINNLEAAMDDDNGWWEVGEVIEHFSEQVLINLEVIGSDLNDLGDMIVNSLANPDKPQSVEMWLAEIRRIQGLIQ